MTDKIYIESEIFTPEGIVIIEKRYEAVYVCETCVGAPARELGMWNWLNYPVAVFYQSDESKVPEGGSQYFGMYHRTMDPDLPPCSYIRNAISAAQTPIVGVRADDGQIIYSRYRHDFRTSADGSVWIDGGRDYVRYDGRQDRIVNLHIKEGKLVVGPVE